VEREKRRRSGLFSALFEDDPWEEDIQEARPAPPEEDWEEAPPPRRRRPREERAEAPRSPRPREDEWEGSPAAPPEGDWEEGPSSRRRRPREGRAEASRNPRPREGEWEDSPVAPPEGDWEESPSSRRRRPREGRAEASRNPRPREGEWEDSPAVPPEEDWEETPREPRRPALPAGEWEEAEAPEEPPRRVLIRGESPYAHGLPGRRFADEAEEEEGGGREKKGLFGPEAQTPIEDGRTVVLVLQTILCCILLTVALVARQSGPERFAAFGSGLGELLEGDGKSLLEQLEGSPAEEFLAHLLSREKAEGQDARQPDPAQEEGQEPDGEEPLDFDWEEAGQLLEEPAGGVAAVMGRATLWIGGLQMPVAGALTSPYGYRIHPITEKRGFHSGVDLAAVEGAEVSAAMDGRVVETGSDETYGEYVVLNHGNVSTKYAHCSRTLVSPGDRVRQGEAIALVGNTGLSTGPHLHFEVWLDGSPVNPAWALTELASAAMLA
jgi:murein DD-endopeptidase MepM/ murein hydrolase activator NlpD